MSFPQGRPLNPQPVRSKSGFLQHFAAVAGILIGVCGLCVGAAQLLQGFPIDSKPSEQRKPSYQPKPSYRPLPVSEPRPGPVPSGKAVFTDDFNTKSNAWAWGTGDNSSYVNHEGAMYIIIKRASFLAWNTPAPDSKSLPLENALVEVDITSLVEQGSSARILCRYQNRDNYYQFEIFSDATFAIHKRLHERWKTLIPRSAAKELKGDRLSIQAACVGGSGTEPVQLMLWSGRQGLVSATDEDQPLPAGQVAIAAATDEDQDYADVAFDRFVLSQIIG